MPTSLRNSFVGALWIDGRAAGDTVLNFSWPTGPPTKVFTSLGSIFSTGAFDQVFYMDNIVVRYETAN
jgi:hypothetical protein